MIWGWLFSGLSIVGAILNARMIKWGFIIWIVANTCWIVFNYHTETYEQIPIWVVFSIISAYGFIAWHRKEKVAAQFNNELETMKKEGRSILITKGKE